MRKFAINIMWLSIIMIVLVISSDKKDEYQEKVISESDHVMQTTANLDI
ncbi:MAG: hypothetical protein NE330_21140 [Lentisphaeraceae bacterium]|nr:hypothetical protein [Lentisphaeraceae bacterium]